MSFGSGTYATPAIKFHRDCKIKTSVSEDVPASTFKV
jgi:hypothetical protein